MASRTLELGALAERLESLEKQNRRLKYAGAAFLLLVFAAVLMGQAWPPSEFIEARGFIVRDADGKLRAALGAGEIEPGLFVPGLFLYDADGMQRVALSLAEAGPRLSLYDADGDVVFVAP